MAILTKVTIVFIFFLLGVCLGHLWAVPDDVTLIKSSEGNAEVKTLPVGWTVRREQVFSPETEGTKRREWEKLISNIQKGEVPESWDGAIDRIIKLSPDHFEADKALHILFIKWSGHDFEAAMKRAAGMGVLANKLRREIYSRLAAGDPYEALRYYEKHKEDFPRVSSFQDYAITEIARNWALRSPEEAWEWCYRLEEEHPGWNGGMRAFFESLETHKPEEVRKYLDMVYKEKGAVPSGIISHWASRHPEKALEWVNDLAEKNRNNHHLNEAIKGIAKTDLKHAEELISKLPQNDQYNCIGSIVESLKKENGHKVALTWEMKMNPEATPSVFLWAGDDPDECRQWLESLPPTEGRNNAIASYARNVPSIDLYAETIKFAENSITDPAIKAATFQTIVKNWEHIDPEGFNTWVNSTDCSVILGNQLKDLMGKEE